MFENISLNKLNQLINIKNKYNNDIYCKYKKSTNVKINIFSFELFYKFFFL